jgi:hypothetical protein
LNPHLVSLDRASENRRRLCEALALHESTRTAVVLLEADDRVAFASSAARELIDRYLGERGARLPDSLLTWLRERRCAATDEPLRINAGDRSLVVEFVDGALLLDVRRRLPPLTAREREILDLVAEGRTNAEIAERLWGLVWDRPEASRPHLRQARRPHANRSRGCTGRAEIPFSRQLTPDQTRSSAAWASWRAELFWREGPRTTTHPDARHPWPPEAIRRRIESRSLASRDRSASRQPAATRRASSRGAERPTGARGWSGRFRQLSCRSVLQSVVRDGRGCARRGRGGARGSARLRVAVRRCRRSGRTERRR